MKFAGNTFAYYWHFTKIPMLILVLWGIASIIVAKFSLYWYSTIFGGIAGILVQIAVFAFIGYTAIAENKGTPSISAWAGAIAGAVTGLIGAVLGILLVYFVPQIIEPAVQEAIAKGAQESMVRSMIQIGQYISFVTGPLFGAFIGALISWIAGLVTIKTRKKKV